MSVHEPGAALTRLHNELDRMFEGFNPAQFFGFGPTADRRWMPALDVYEKDNFLVVEADLPGVPKEAIKISCTNHVLTIEGETKSETEEKKDGYYRSERRYGSFSRAVPLPEDADYDHAKAEFKDGVLKVSLPKASRPEEKVHTIPVV